MRRIKRYQVAAYSCLVIKYEHDKRYSEDGVSTHDRYFFMLTFLLKINCIFFQFCYKNIILNFSWARIWECLSIHLCVCLSVCVSQILWGNLETSEMVEFGWNFAHLFLGWISGVYFSFFKKFDFWGLGTSFCQYEAKSLCIYVLLLLILSDLVF